jgi:lipopolysaccharide export system protein LptA
VRRAWGASLVALALGAPGALAQLPLFGGQDNGKPIGITADNGIEWQQNNRVYIARGHATATRGDDSVIADTLYAFYRPVGPAPPPAHVGKNDHPDAFSGGQTEIYRLEADGNVLFKAPSGTMFGDHAVYDVDKAVLVATGKDLRLVTPREIITARDSLEWYDTPQVGVARGNAVAVRADRRVRADILTAHVTKAADGTSHISRIDANGSVVMSSPGQIARGDAGVYNVDTGIATLTGNVRLTRGDNELQGRYAVVDLNNNVSRLLAAPPGAQVAGEHAPRVEGLIMPRRPADTAGH